MKQHFLRALLLISLSLVSTAQWAKAVNVPAEDFTLKSAAGENIRLSEYRGQVVLVNFWASWCGPCRQEFPHLSELHEKYSDLGFTVFGINVEQSRDLADRVLRDIPVVFPILFDAENAVSRAYGVDAMPMTVLVDRNGDIRYTHRGYKPGYETTYDEQIRLLVRE